MVIDQYAVIISYKHFNNKNPFDKLRFTKCSKNVPK